MEMCLYAKQTFGIPLFPAKLKKKKKKIRVTTDKAHQTWSSRGICFGFKAGEIRQREAVSSPSLRTMFYLFAQAEVVGARLCKRIGGEHKEGLKTLKRSCSQDRFNSTWNFFDKMFAQPAFTFEQIPPAPSPSRNPFHSLPKLTI